MTKSNANIDCEEIECFDGFRSFYSNEGILVLHLNIRSFYKNINSFLVFLEALGVKLDIIILSVAWLYPEKSITYLQDYNYYFTSQTYNRNDGVVVYIKSDICADCKDITLGKANGLLIEFNLNKPHYNLVAMYKSPSMGRPRPH